VANKCPNGTQKRWQTHVQMEHRKGGKHMSKWNTEKVANTGPKETQKRWHVHMEHRTYKCRLTDHTTGSHHQNRQQAVQIHGATPTHVLPWPRSYPATATTSTSTTGVSFEKFHVQMRDMKRDVGLAHGQRTGTTHVIRTQCLTNARTQRDRRRW